MGLVRIATWFLLAGLGVAAMGCADGGEPDRSSPAPAISPTGGPERIALSLEHDGRTVVVEVSSRITLVLGGRYRWIDPTSEGAPVDVVGSVSDAPEGAQMWELGLSETGTSVLRTVGSPACRPTTPGCPESDRSYTVTLEIRN